MIFFGPKQCILVVTLAIWSAPERIPARGIDSLSFSPPLLLLAQTDKPLVLEDLNPRACVVTRKIWLCFQVSPALPCPRS